MRRVVLYLAALLVAVGVLLVVQRLGEDPFVECTASQLGETSHVAESGPAFTSVRLESVAPIGGALAADVKPGSDGLYVATKGGEVHLVEAGSLNVIVDLTGEVSTTGEQGLLGLAIDPDGDYLYLDYTDVEDHTQVVEYALDGSGIPALDSRREVLFVEQPFHTHNGGHLEFTSDGLLWIGLGDGGGSLAGPGHGFGFNSQDPGTLLGSILRIDPRPGGNSPYGIPPDNPFVGREGARAEIWAMGLRNPWRFSIDPATGDLWIADVGQACWEEINYLPADRGAGAGANLGWDIVEGVDKYEGGDTDGLVWPAYVEGHDEGNCSIVGGVVYRGDSLPELGGWYVFTDTCNGELRALREVTPGVLTMRSLGISLSTPVSFGYDADGEVLTLSLVEGVGRLVPMP